MIWIIVGGVLLFIFLSLVILYVRAVAANRKIQAKIEEDVHQMMMHIRHGGYCKEDIFSLAERLDTRSHFYRQLCEEGKNWVDLFPSQYSTIEKIAESDLAVWLLHPNELNSLPDEIEFVQRYEEKDDSDAVIQFLLFKFRTLEPHWAAKKSWLAGIAGPYEGARVSRESPPCVFSRFEEFNTRSPEEHCDILKETVIATFCKGR